MFTQATTIDAPFASFAQGSPPQIELSSVTEQPDVPVQPTAAPGHGVGEQLIAYVTDIVAMLPLAQDTPHVCPSLVLGDTAY